MEMYQGVELRDGVYYKPFTTLEGIAEKHSGRRAIQCW